jgi:hypothetical protein
MNYNIKDVNRDGFINEADGAERYPQGHGDAWGTSSLRCRSTTSCCATRSTPGCRAPSRLAWPAPGRGGLLRRAPVCHRGGRQGEDRRRDRRPELPQAVRGSEEPGVRRHASTPRTANCGPGARRTGASGRARARTSTGSLRTQSSHPRTTATRTCARSTARQCRVGRDLRPVPACRRSWTTPTAALKPAWAGAGCAALRPRPGPHEDDADKRGQDALRAGLRPLALQLHQRANAVRLRQ